MAKVRLRGPLRDLIVRLHSPDHHHPSPHAPHCAFLPLPLPSLFLLLQSTPYNHLDSSKGGPPALPPF
ncbi:hypothetical protein E2C01_061442 [Portunus trituberculatus]|uniref:Uncharacterized protein n=1 Tax=Portunus trituberculatus TaxID=210409 RepID=A0A5B7HBN7_PORTR|nr:hypothetical protein [Portunus trituberculatus]